MITDINTADRLTQQPFADYFRNALGWEGFHACIAETFGPHGMISRARSRGEVLVHLIYGVSAV